MMMQKNTYSEKNPLADVAIMLIILLLGYAIISITNLLHQQYQPEAQINLSLWALPYYTMLSACRGFVAYFLSLFFTLIVGYAAAKSVKCEKIIVPILDVLQSVPVFGLLPGLMLLFIRLFPHSYFGLECVAIIAIFTGQVWNMTFSLYHSLKLVPKDLEEAASILNLGPLERFFHVELPFAATGLAWNSVLSMAGGWFFLIPCEAFDLGELHVRLPGLGSYIDVALKAKNITAIICSLIAMVVMIVGIDVIIWRPLLVWVQKFAHEEAQLQNRGNPLMLVWLRQSMIVLKLSRFYEAWIFKPLAIGVQKLSMKGFAVVHSMKSVSQWIIVPLASRFFIVLLGVLILIGTAQWLVLLSSLTLTMWSHLLLGVFFTTLRCLAAVILSTLWCVPFGIWLALSLSRIALMQPVLQVLASFPASMLYPLLYYCFQSIHIPNEITSIFLLVLGVQWYILFNVLSGALNILLSLRNVTQILNFNTWQCWKNLYLPSIMPALVTGWITAAGSAWNASLVTEYLEFSQYQMIVPGIGSQIRLALLDNDQPRFLASLLVLIAVILFLNRFFWEKLCKKIYMRYRLD